jgi:hypothetical protein
MSQDAPAPRLNDVLRRIWTNPCSIKSDFARANAAWIAAAASQGLITTRLDRETYGARWLITPAGLDRIFRFKLSTGGGSRPRKGSPA